MSKKIVIVETLSVFKHKYAVEVREESHALDEVVCNLGNPNFTELSQVHLDEIISGHTVVDAREYLKLFDKENDYLKDWTEDQKFSWINKAEYGDESIDLQSRCRGDKFDWEFS